MKLLIPGGNLMLLAVTRALFVLFAHDLRTSQGEANRKLLDVKLALHSYVGPRQVNKVKVSCLAWVRVLDRCVCRSILLTRQTHRALCSRCLSRNTIGMASHYPIPSSILLYWSS